MELDALAERILTDLSAVFKRDLFVHEFDLVAVVESQNKSPVIHIGHRLALESWCVKHLYYHSYNKLFDWKEKKRKVVTEPEKIIRWTNAVLLLNPDIATAWNIRKEMILAGNLLSKHELNFAYVVLTRKPKSPEVFAHRKWLLSSIMSNKLTFDGTLDEIIDRELELCTITASRYPNNYHSWSHRIWVLKNINKNISEILTKELATSEEWVSTHVSDHSGIQYRQYLIEHLINPNSDEASSSSANLYQNRDKINVPNIQSRNNSQLLNAANILGKEIEFSTELICLYPGHEALWYHRRFVVYMCKKCSLLSDNLSSISVKSSSLYKKTKLENNSCGFVLLTLEKELAFLEQCSTQLRENLIQSSHANKYRKWLTTSLGLTV